MTRPVSLCLACLLAASGSAGTWADSSDEADSLGFHGVAVGVLVPHDATSRNMLVDMVGLGLQQVDDEDAEQVVLRPVFPNGHGQRHFMAKVPAGTYMLSGFGFRSPNDETIWVELDMDGPRVSVLPHTLTDLGQMVFLSRRTGIYSQVAMAHLSEGSDAGRVLSRHPHLSNHVFEDMRGWDKPSIGRSNLADRIRGEAALSGPPVSVSAGFDVVPTMLGDFAVRLEDGEWRRVRGPGAGRLHRVLVVEDSYLLAVGESGLHLGRIDDRAQWETLPINHEVMTVVDAVLAYDRLILLAEERLTEATRRRFPPFDDQLQSHATASVLAMPWPALDRVSVLDRVSIPVTLDLAETAALTSELALIPRGDGRYRWLSLVDETRNGELTEIEQVHSQGDHVFFKPADSGEWVHVIDGDLSRPEIIKNVRTRQPPVVLPDGRLLVHGRVLETSRITSAGYYWSLGGQANWQLWHRSNADCDRPEELYLVENALYQYCQSGLVFRSEIDDPDWTLEGHGTRSLQAAFPVGDRNIDL